MSVNDVVLHLDEPRVTPPNSEYEVKGWIASRSPVEKVVLDRPGETIVMALTDRPDVRAAMHAYPCTTGFVGYANAHFIKSNALVFHATIDGRVCDLSARLDPFPIKPINPLPDVPADDPATKAEKFRRLAGRLSCPVCRAALPGESPRCSGCGAAFTFAPGCWDFLTAAQAESVPAPDATPASRGGLDEVAYAIIERYRDGVILDCGAGCKDRTFPNVVNLDIMAYPSTDVRALNEALPFADATFDAVFSFSTLEHVRDPFIAGREIARVTKPGGIVYSVVPLLAPYHGFPEHFYNMTLDGHKNLYAGSLEVLHAFVPLFGRPIHALTWMLNSWARGLPENQREAFLDLRVRDLTANPFQLLNESYVRYLSAATNMELAAVTAIIARKPDGSAPGPVG